MSQIDENKILDRLKRLSQVEPAKEAADHAMQRVRDTLMSEKAIPTCGTGFQPVKTRPGWPCHVLSLKAVFRRKLPPIVAKLAAAAVLMIGAGFIGGRVSAPEPLDVHELQAALESSLKSSLVPAIRQELLSEMDDRWQSTLAASNAKVKDELARQVRRDLMEFAAQTLAASGTRTDQRLMELIELIDAVRLQDHRRMASALDYIESRFGNGLVTLAVRTDELLGAERAGPAPDVSEH
ncbi:MAG TPA: hypothetical protein VMX36_03930 [Sedimentisphaerales bacterium]|nr:hypothetical protein [Sedimentisphaerales bacterium]